MIRLDARMFSRGSSAVLASAVMACCAGCTGQVYARPATVEVQPLVAAPVEVDSEVVYAPDPPVVDIESYPTVFYGGVQVYYVGGYWYQQGPRGWAYYRQEPPELGRQRQEHWQRDHDQRWADQREGDRGGQDNRGVTEAQPPDRRAPPPPPPPQALPRREETPPRPAPAVQPRRVETPLPVPTVQPRRKVAPPPPVPKRLLPVRPAPAHPPAPPPPPQRR